MTNEDIVKAIEVLEVHKAHWERLLDNGICDVLEGGNTIQALKVAIRALKNEQTDGDLISRKEAEKCCLDGWNKDYKDILEDIRKLPSAGNTAEPEKPQ